MSKCVFCQKIADRDNVWEHPELPVVCFEPLDPITPGHMLFVPKHHTPNYMENPLQTGLTYMAAAEYAYIQGGSSNLITSAGTDATQTVFHLHVHYVPRSEGDGLVLPWTNQVKQENL